MEQICSHGCKVWKNYGDGKVRHMGDTGPTMHVCDDPDMRKDETK